MSDAAKMTPIQLADELSLTGRNGFLTSTSNGTVKQYVVQVRFSSLKEMQDFYSALYFIINRQLGNSEDVH